MATGKFKYAVLEGDAVLLGEYEAWNHVGGVWKEMSAALAFTQATLISKATFDRMFGTIETSLPTEAFRDG